MLLRPLLPPAPAPAPAFGAPSRVSRVGARAARTAPGWLRTAAFGSFALAALAGCGHKASDTDCAFILDRNVEVQMKVMHITDPVAIDKRKQEIQAELKGQLQGCIGKRITDAMLACVARAQTADAIDECMR
jgi:hypothetical protein